MTGRSRYLLTIPEAGRLLGLGRTASYEAVRRGDLPVLRINGRRLVPVAKLEQLLGRAIDPADLAEVRND
jgi:excisionase family DNA binding protein